MTMKLLLLLVGTLLLLAGCRQDPEESAVANDPGPAAENVTGEKDGEAAETATPQPTQVVFGTTILANGQLVAVNPPLPLSFKTGGRLLDVRVAAGDQVSAGDLMATRVQANDIQMNLGDCDNAMDVMFLLTPYWSVPMNWGWDWSWEAPCRSISG